MNLTEDMRRAAALLGLDPENPRHRDLLAKCIDKALAQPPARGRPKGTGIWDDAKLSGLAHLVDFLKNVLAGGGAGALGMTAWCLEPIPRSRK